MPYIKYRGVWSAGIREQVCYEDPSAPCQDGYERLWAEARRVVEDAVTDPIAREHAIKSYVSDHPYPGLSHLGGTGFIEDKPALPVCEEISANEYEELCGEIKKANTEYLTRKADTLSKNNDPTRRASPEDEKLGWRTRVWITSYTELEHHVAYPLGERSVAYLRMREDEPSGSGRTAQLIDIYHSTNGDVQQALLDGTDWAEMLVDMLAVAGYGAAHVERVLGTTVPYSRIGEEFQLATFDLVIRNTPVQVLPSHFIKTKSDEAGLLILRHVRDGLSAAMPTAAFTAFWNALELQADEEARTKKLYRIVECSECGAERTAGFDLKQGFVAMYTEAGLDPALFDRHRSKRGIIQHGSKLPSADYVDKVFQDLSHMQTAAMIAVTKKTGITPRTISYLATCWPISVFSCCAKNDGNVVIKNSSMKVNAALNTLPQRIGGDAGRTIFFGMASQPKIDPLSLPPIQC